MSEGVSGVSLRSVLSGGSVLNVSLEGSVERVSVVRHWRVSLVCTSGPRVCHWRVWWWTRVWVSGGVSSDRVSRCLKVSQGVS